MLQRMEVRERERLANDERRHQLEMEEQRKRKVCACLFVGVCLFPALIPPQAILESTREQEAARMKELEKRQVHLRAKAYICAPKRTFARQSAAFCR
jgi:hypothetical protein